MPSVSQRTVDLSHPILDGMVTYPGLPVPVIGDHLTREAAEAVYGRGVTFQIGLITMCTNTGTYLDVPFHRFADGHDLSGLDLARVAAVPAVCFDRRGERAIDIDAADLAGLADVAGLPDVADLAGHAVLFRTDHSAYFGTDRYAVEHPHLTAASAAALAAANVAVVGIDSLNIDDTNDGARPVHTTLLRAGIPIVEHLTGLDALPPTGFTFTAVPPKVVGAGTFPVRAYATLAS